MKETNRCHNNIYWIINKNKPHSGAFPVYALKHDLTNTAPHGFLAQAM